MNSTGIVRKTDELGRVVLPAETRRMLDIQIKDSIEIFVDGDKILLRKYAPGCVFCGEASDEIQYFHGKPVCEACRDQMKQS